MKQIFKVSGIFMFSVIAVFVVFILVIQILDYKPASSEVLFVSDSSSVISDTTVLDFYSWNIGYCGLDKDMDFFYEKGKQVRPSSMKKVENNLHSIIKNLKENISTDFYFLQEVDVKSKRSYKMNEFDSISSAFSNYISILGINYNVLFIPVPLSEPMGKTLSGIITMSKFIPDSIVRYSYKGNYSFPKSLFMLDRCFLVSSFKVNNGKKLYIINTHNSAFDDGSLRKIQMEQLREFILGNYKSGHYVIVGGDWNQCPPTIEKTIPGWNFDDKDFIRIEKNFLPHDWKWVYSNDVPTNRRVNIPYKKEITKTTIIDYFLVSPNIFPVYIENKNLEFENSDHNPIRAGFEFISD